MKVLISGGGTAGHINPAIAIGTCLQKMGAQVMYVGSDGSLEQKLYSKTGCPFLQFASKGLNRKNLFKNFEVLSTDYKAYLQIQKAIDELKACVDSCALCGVPILVVHAFIGFENHTPTKIGLVRFGQVVDYARKKAIRIAFENTEVEE